MEKENLSQTFIQKYDKLSDSFVVVENKEEKEQKTRQRRFEPFSFFNLNNKAQANQESDQTSPPPVSNPAVSISKDLYNMLKILESLYQNLSLTDFENSSLYDELAAETSILSSTMLSIYQLLSGTTSIPNQNQKAPILTGEICSDRITVEKYIQKTINYLLKLQNMINVDNIDRQLVIITLTLFSQKNQLKDLQSSCRRGE